MTRTSWGYVPSKLAEVFSSSIILEALVYPKPGNVSRYSEYEDLKFEHFLRTGIIAYKYFIEGIERGYSGWGDVVFGDLIYRLMSEVIRVVGTNTCLGSSLLLMPMSIGAGQCIRSHNVTPACIINGAVNAVRSSTVFDAIYFYKAVRVAHPSYLKKEDETGDFVNVWDNDYEAKLLAKGHRLLDVLEFSSRADIVARELIEGYSRSAASLEFLEHRIREHGEWERAIAETYLALLLSEDDTVIKLKHGSLTLSYVKSLVEGVYTEVVGARNGEWKHILAALDDEFKLHRINPGAVADIMVSTIALYLLKNAGVT